MAKQASPYVQSNTSKSVSPKIDSKGYAPFLSTEGQKQRITNVVQVLGAATGISKLLGKGSAKDITANTSNPSLNKALTTVAQHPYATAGVIAAGYTAIKAAPALFAKSPVIPSTGTMATTVSKLKGMSTILGAGLIGVGAGTLLSKGGSNAPQSTNPIQTTNQTTSNITRTRTQADQTTYNVIEGSPYAQLYGNPSQSVEPSVSSSASPSLTASQPISQEQTAGGSNWTTIALIGVAAYFLLK